MSIGEKRQLTALRYRLYRRPLHPELFEIRRQDRIVNGSYEAQVWVTPCTHVVSFFRDETALVELTADTTLDLPERGLLVELPLRGEREHEWSADGTVTYMMNFEVEKMSPAVYEKTHRDLSSAGTKRGLFVEFPEWASGSLTPFSFVDCEARAKQLHVFAFHALPDEATFVKTQSIFELK